MNASPRKSGSRSPLRFIPWIHRGASIYIMFIALGMTLLALHLPPGPLPYAVFIADAPFLWLLFFSGGGDRWKRWALVYGAVHFAFAMRWLYEVQPMQVLASAVILGPTFLVWGSALRMLVRRGVPLAIATGTVVVLEEIMRTRWMGGMPWPARSLAFASDQSIAAPMDALVSSSAFFGSYALSFFAGATSAVVARIPFWLMSQGDARTVTRRSVIREAVFVLCVLVLLGVLGSVRRSGFRERVENGQCHKTQHELLVIQAAIPQSLKNARDDWDGLKQMFARHEEISKQALGAAPGGNAPYFGVLWPETMIPWPFLSPDLAARFPRKWMDQVNVMRRIKAIPSGEDLHWLIGAIQLVRRGDERHENMWAYGTRDSVFYVRPRYAPGQGEKPPLPDPLNPHWIPPWTTKNARHDKVRLVPGGEYTPLGDWIPPLKLFREWVAGIPELDPGDVNQPPFRLHFEGAHLEHLNDGSDLVMPVGTVICFEIAFPARCRKWRSLGAKVLLNAANYGWFGKTDFRSQVQSMARLRSAECGVTTAMAGNTGPSAFFDPIGGRYGTFVDAETGESEPCGPLETTHRAGWARAPLYLDAKVPLYVKIGDLPWFALGAALLAWAFLRSRRVKIRGTG